MSHIKVVLLEFIGGPFDGFKRTLTEPVDDLPNAIALPLNRRTRTVFSLKGEESKSTAIYKLKRQGDRLLYRFWVTRKTPERTATRID